MWTKARTVPSSYDTAHTRPSRPPGSFISSNQLLYLEDSAQLLRTNVNAAFATTGGPFSSCSPDLRLLFIIDWSHRNTLRQALVITNGPFHLLRWRVSITLLGASQHRLRECVNTASRVIREEPGWSEAKKELCSVLRFAPTPRSRLLLSLTTNINLPHDQDVQPNPR